MALWKRGASNPEGRMALKEHLKELRNRLFIAAIAIILGAVGGFFLYQPLFHAIMEPVMEVNAQTGRQATINFDGVASSFDTMVKMSFFIGFIISSPVWIYELWAFITPGLRSKERRIALGFMAAAVPLFLAGVWLAWLILPNAVHVLTDFTPEGASNFITGTTYISFVTRLMLAFGIAFLLPVVLFGLNLVGLLKARQILKAWRIVVFLICLFAAMAAPGSDAMSMFYLAAPMLILFATAFLLCWINDRRREKRVVERDAMVEADIDTATPLKDLGI